MRDLSTLFNEEARSLTQSQLHRLVVIELKALSLATGTAGSSTVAVNSSIDFMEGMHIRINGTDYTYKIESVDRIGHTIMLNKALDEDVSSAVVFQALAVCDSNFPLTFDGVVYSQFPISLSDLSSFSDGSIDTATLTVANVSREMMYYVESLDGLRGRTVYIKSVFERFLDFKYTVSPDGTLTITDNPEADPDSCVDDFFRIDSYTANESTVVFQLEPSANLSVKIPIRKFTSDCCTWKYRDPTTCCFDIDAFLAENITFSREDIIVCRKQLSDCELRKNTARFGAFPGISGQRRVYL